MRPRFFFSLALLLCFAVLCANQPIQAAAAVPTGTPDATIDLTTNAGTHQIEGIWRYSDAKIIEVDFRSPGPDRKPTGAPNRTYDVSPHAGVADFDDSQWERIDPTALADRRSTGKVCFNWYRINITVPERVGDFDPTGSDVVLETVVDDYAEVWVDGVLARELGQVGGSVAAGWNAPNRVMVGHHVMPGQKIQLAIFGINGPISDAPANFIWIRSAKLDFYSSPRAVANRPVRTEILRLDPALDAIISPDAVIEQLAEGFTFGEGPVWTGDNALLFSDPNDNVIYRRTADGQLSVFRKNSGYSGADIAEYRQPGSNGLTLDSQGRLTICEHGNRRVTRLEKDGSLTVLADRYQGKRLNSPNDLVYRSDGALFFTDPYFGLPKLEQDPRKELKYSGVFCLINGKLKLVSTDFTGPNGLAFSPGEKHLYVANWDTQKKVVHRYMVAKDGSLSKGELFFDMTSAPGEEALDGLKVDQLGNLFVSGPGGVWVISPDGKHLGTIVGPELAANFAWGDDGKTLYMTARSGLYCIRLNVAGVRPEAILSSAQNN